MSNDSVSLADPLWFPPSLGYQSMLTKHDREAAYRVCTYWWAWCVLEELNHPDVLDLGCGSGYGCKIMAQRHHDTAVVGVDEHAGAIMVARNSFDLDNIHYHQLNLDMEWRQVLDGAMANMITCFQLLESIHRDGLFLLDICRRVAPDGIFLLSLKRMEGEGETSRAIEQHDLQDTQYSVTDTEDLLSRFFGDVVVMNDRNVTTIIDNSKHALRKSCMFVRTLNRTYPRLENGFGQTLFACWNPLKPGECR